MPLLFYTEMVKSLDFLEIEALCQGGYKSCVLFFYLALFDCLSVVAVEKAEGDVFTVGADLFVFIEVEQEEVF